MSWISRFANCFRGARLERDLEDELRFHLEERAAELIRGGMPASEAARQARRQLGSPLRLAESSRDVKLLGRLESLLQDLRFGLRMLARSRLSTAAAVLSLALAIGASTAAFSLIEALILRPLPVWEPQRLVYLTNPYWPDDPRENDFYSYPFFVRLRQAARPHADMFALSLQRLAKAAFDDAAGQPEKVRTQWISGDAMPLLGIRPEIGRLLTPEDDLQPGQHPVAVISHSFWMRRFGGSPAALGKWLALDDKRFQIVGVARKGFTGAEPGIASDMWVPLMMWNQRAFTAPGSTWFRIWGRLKPGVAPETARQAMQAVYTHFLRERAAELPPDEPRALLERYLRTPLHLRSAANGPSFLRREFERPLWILAAVVGLVLLIACFNVANLMMWRAAARSREMALRVSIGAGRGRLIQQMLVESAVLAAAACLLGIAFARVAAPALVGMLGMFGEPAWLELRFGWQAMAFVSALGAAATLLFGLAPALGASAVAPDAALKQSGARVSGRMRWLRPLVAAQVAFSFVVLFAAGLLLISFRKLTTVDLGFTKEGVVQFSLQGKPRAPHSEVLEQVRALPMVQNAGLSGMAVFSRSTWSQQILVPGKPRDGLYVHFLDVSPGLLETMRIRLLEGRGFRPADMSADSRQVIVNQAFARRYFAGESAVGRRFDRLNRGGPSLQTIIGVVRDARYNDVRQPAPPTVYVPLETMAGASLAVRTAADPIALATAVRDRLRQVDPALRIGEIRLQSTLVEEKLVRERLLALLSGFFAVVAATLAAVGLYGVLSASVVRRTREIGIRVALGAGRPAVVRLVVAEILAVTAVGLAAGIAAGMALSRWMVSLLYEIKPAEGLPAPLALLAAICALAAAAPALRAARVDPLIALRYE